MSPYTGPSVSIHVAYFVDPSKISAFLDVLRPLWKQVIAEPECISFEVFQNSDVPGELKFIENYNASRDWVENVQVKKGYYDKPRGEAMPLLIKPPEFTIYERNIGKEFLYIGKELLEQAR